MNRLHSLSSAALRTLAATAMFFALAGVTGCSEDDGPGHNIGYYYPEWSGDGTKVAFIETGKSVPNALLICDTSGARTKVSIPVVHTQRFWLNTHTAYYAANLLDASHVNGGEIMFYGSDGSVQSPVPDAGGCTPYCADFTDGQYVWVGVTNNAHTVIGVNQHNGSPWLPTNSVIIKDTALGSIPQDIVYTSASSCAIRLRDGHVLEFGLDGSVISDFSFIPKKLSDFVSRDRLRYLHDGSTRRLYTIADSGIAMLDLQKKTIKYPIYGSIVNFDISSATGTLLMETLSGDIWLHTRDGAPLARLAPHNIMPALSPNGKWFAAVGPVPKSDDTLTIVNYAR